MKAVPASGRLHDIQFRRGNIAARYGVESGAGANGVAVEQLMYAFGKCEIGNRVHGIVQNLETGRQVLQDGGIGRQAEASGQGSAGEDFSKQRQAVDGVIGSYTWIRWGWWPDQGCSEGRYLAQRFDVRRHVVVVHPALHPVAQQRTESLAFADAVEQMQAGVERGREERLICRGDGAAP